MPPDCGTVGDSVEESPVDPAQSLESLPVVLRAQPLLFESHGYVIRLGFGSDFQPPAKGSRGPATFSLAVRWGGLIWPCLQTKSLGDPSSDIFRRFVH